MEAKTTFLSNETLWQGTAGPSRNDTLETFPHAIVCALAGKVVATKPRTLNRRKALRDLGYDDSPLPNIDFVDAAWNESRPTWVDLDTGEKVKVWELSAKISTAVAGVWPRQITPR
jgi:hypothetical protein